MHVGPMCMHHLYHPLCFVLFAYRNCVWKKSASCSWKTKIVLQKPVFCRYYCECRMRSVFSFRRHVINTSALLAMCPSGRWNQLQPRVGGDKSKGQPLNESSNVVEHEGLDNWRIYSNTGELILAWRWFLCESRGSGIATTAEFSFGK